jgi:predicted RND superfamily exporter protein
MPVDAEGAGLESAVGSALTTIASFGSLGLVPHLGMASLGRLLVIGVSCTMVANLILLPAFLELGLLRRLHRKPSA